MKMTKRFTAVIASKRDALLKTARVTFHYIMSSYPVLFSILNLPV